MNLYKVTASVLLVTLVLFLLEQWKELLIPLVIAIGLWFFFNAVASWLGKVSIKGATLPLWSRYLITAVGVGLFGYFLTDLIGDNISKLQDKLPFYQSNFQALEAKLLDKLGMEKFPVIPEGTFSNINVSGILTSVFDSLSSVLSNTFLILIYFIFLLIEQRVFGKKIKSIFGKENEEKVEETTTRVKQSIESYILIKTLVSLLTGFLSFLVLTAVGVDFAFFWAFLIFLLNYIPSIGSLIATVFPVILAVIQFETLIPAAIILVAIGSIQVLVGNFLEPKLFGSSLKISSFAVILSLTFWGMIWGVTGMFLCVPITVILMIIANNFKDTRPIALLLSDDGEF